MKFSITASKFVDFSEEFRTGNSLETLQSMSATLIAPMYEMQSYECGVEIVDEYQGIFRLSFDQSVIDEIHAKDAYVSVFGYGPSAKVSLVATVRVEFE